MSDLKLQPGDYTTREEITSYAERVGITLEESYQSICDALVGAGAGFGEGLAYFNSNVFNCFGWLIDEGVYYFTSSDQFTRHLAPEQILSAGKQEDLQSEKQTDGVALPPRDLQSVISDYLWLLNSLTDEQARDIIKTQITDLTDLQYSQYTAIINGE